MLHTWAGKYLLYVLYITVDRLNPSMFSPGKFSYISNLELSENRILILETTRHSHRSNRRVPASSLTQLS